MTVSGLCDSASSDLTRLTRALAFQLQPAWRRTIVYPWSWQVVIESARDVAVAGVKTLVVFNTEAWGGVVDDLTGMANALDRFLGLAAGAVAAIESGNELDTPGWTDSHGAPITDALIAAVGRRAAEVCRRHGVICLAPSLLSGPTEGRFQRIASGVVGHVDAMAVHPYYRSVGGYPWPGWTFGSVEAAADECQRLGSGLPTWFTEVGCTTRYDSIGQIAQANYTTALRGFQHPSIPVVMQFALYDRCGSQHELEVEHKDWGLIADGGVRKRSFAAFAEAAPEVSVPPTPPHTHDVGEGLLQWMAEDQTAPVSCSTFLPLGRNPAEVECAYSVTGDEYRWSLVQNRRLSKFKNSAA